MSIYNIIFFVSFNIGIEEICPKGWVELDHCEGSDTICAKVGHPLKYVSWFSLQYHCDVMGGYLPEPTGSSDAQFRMIQKYFDQLYGETLMYLGATDVSDNNNWKWLNSKKDLVGNKWDATKTEKKNCLAASSGTGLWQTIDCEDDEHESQIAFVCMRKKDRVKSSTL